jgi:hypothetical protein
MSRLFDGFNVLDHGSLATASIGANSTLRRCCRRAAERSLFLALEIGSELFSPGFCTASLSYITGPPVRPTQLPLSGRTSFRAR